MTSEMVIQTEGLTKRFGNITAWATSQPVFPILGVFSRDSIAFTPWQLNYTRQRTGFTSS